jgi:thioredoxin 1
MKKITFKDSAVAKFFNANFINVEMDMERGEGKELSKKLDIRAYPTLFFINGKEQVINKKVGYLDADSCLYFGKSVMVKK